METPPPWDDERLLAFASTGTILLRDRGSRQAPMGPWLAAHAERFDLPTDSWPPPFSSYRRDDRLVAHGAFRESCDRPGAIVEYVASWHDGAGWRQLRSRRVNLFDDDRAGVMIITFIDEGPAPVGPDDDRQPERGPIESPPWVIQYLDHLGDIIDTEGMVEELTGRTADELVGTSGLDLIDPSTQADMALVWIELKQRPGEVRTVQVPLRPTAREPAPWVEVTLINRTGVAKQEGSMLAIFHDISAKRAHHESQQAALRHRAEHDGLTHLLNRSTIDARLEAAVVEQRTDLLVLFLDLDGFKAVNDTFGHDAGDTVLRVVAGRLCDAVRPSDDIGRYGGDEFVAICRGVTAAAEEAVVERITVALEVPVVWDGGTWVPRMSIGAARWRPGDDAASLLRRADAAMFGSKAERRHPRCRPGALSASAAPPSRVRTDPG